MTNWQRTIACFVAVSGFVLAAVGFELVRSLDDDGRVDARRSLLSLAADSSRVDALALGVGSGDLRQYDPLVTAVADVKRDIASAERAEPRLMTSAGIGKLKDVVGNRVKKVEEMKSRRSALNNTEMHLPELLAQQRNNDVELALVNFTLAKRSELLTAAKSNLAADDPLLGHVEVLEKKAPDLNKDATDVRDEPLTAHVAELADSYDAVVGADAAWARKVRIGLLMGALLSALTWLWVMGRR
jgi:hypothetical protein